MISINQRMNMLLTFVMQLFLYLFRTRRKNLLGLLVKLRYLVKSKTAKASDIQSHIRFPKSNGEAKWLCVALTNIYNVC